MKIRHILIGVLIWTAFFSLPVLQTGCSTAPSERVAAVTTLKALGEARNTAMQVAGQLWRDGKITDAQRDKIIAYHDGVFQPAYRLAVASVQDNLAAASPDLLNLFAQLQALIQQKP